MNTETGYNGYRNYETWLVNLWLDNGDSVCCLASDFRDLHDFSNAIRDELTDRANDAVGSTGMFSDLLGAALQVVDWRAVAESLADGYFDESDDDDDKKEAE